MDTADHRTNAPEIEVIENGYVNKRRAINDVTQGIAVCEALFKNADDLIRLAAKIREKTDGITPPYKQDMLQQEGKKHKSNVNTGVAEALMGKVAPRLYSYIENARYLDVAALPEVNPVTGEPIADHHRKTQKLREIFTSKVRQWVKWYIFQVALAQEVSRFGHCFCTWLDDMEWRPTLYRLDQAQVPTGTEIMEENIPFFACKETYLVHELFAKIEDKAYAEDEGWDIEQVVEAINSAVPKAQPNAGSEGEYLEYEDLQRECVPGWAYAKEANVIEVYHLFVTEFDGWVSQYCYDKKTKKELFRSLDRYPRMSDVVCPFAFQLGNGKIHGSQGVGHLVYDLSTVMEKSRNGTIDSLRARQRLQLQVGSQQDMAKAKVIINDDATFIVGASPVGNISTLPDVVDSFVNLDRYLRGLLEEKTGSYLPPPQAPGSERTATEANLAALREEETKLAILGYWLKHFSLLTMTMRRRMFNTNSRDKVSLAARREAELANIPPEEVELWANLPAQSSIVDFTNQKEMELASFAASKIGNPNYDQVKLETMQATAILGREYADELIIKGEDQTVQSEAIRTQMMELMLLEAGRPVPISPRDNDAIHMQILMGQEDAQGQYGSGEIARMVQQGNIQGVQAAMEHFQAHVEQAKSKNSLGILENGAKAFTRQVSDAVQQIISMMQQQQAAVGQVLPGADTTQEGDGYLAPGASPQGGTAVENF